MPRDDDDECAADEEQPPACDRWEGASREHSQHVASSLWALNILLALLLLLVSLYLLQRICVTCITTDRKHVRLRAIIFAVHDMARRERS